MKHYHEFEDLAPMRCCIRVAVMQEHDPKLNIVDRGMPSIEHGYYKKSEALKKPFSFNDYEMPVQPLVHYFAWCCCFFERRNNL